MWALSHISVHVSSILCPLFVSPEYLWAHTATFPPAPEKTRSAKVGIEIKIGDDIPLNPVKVKNQVRKYDTPPISEIIWVKNVRAIVVCGFLMKWLKKYILKIWKKSWVPFGSYLLNSTANPAHFHLNWAGLAGNFQTAPTIFSNFQEIFF